MVITIVATVMIWVAYFLILYGVVGFIQDKRFFSSAPKENLEVIPDSKERFRGAHAIGWVIEVIALLMFIGAVVLGVWDGVKNDYGFLNFFARFFIVWRSMISAFLTGCFSVIRTSSHISIRN